MARDRPTGVAVQGERGCFSETAARRLAGAGAVAAWFETFEEVAAAVAAGAVRCGVLPVDNSLAGPVVDLADLLQRHGLVGRTEVTLPIRQCLIAAEPVALETLREVRSHAVALGQCRRFLAEHPWIRPVAVPDTAGAVREVCGAGRRDLAAIGGREAAALYGGAVLVEGIADRPENFTRFVLIERGGEQ
jgi:prephenate dehydratase